MNILPLDTFSYNKNLSFKAEFVKKVPILKYSETMKKHIPCEADFVKFDLKSEADVKTIEKICFNKKFIALGEYLFKMWTDKNWDSPFVKSKNLYGLVIPKDGKYESLDVNDTLGLTEFVENKDKENKIMFMITNQDYQKKYRTDESEYRCIGTGMTNTLKELYPQKPMSVFAEWDAIEFWQKQDFKNITSRKLIFDKNSKN